MIWDILKSKGFNLVFSFLLGLGLIAILKPVCKGDACITLKAPPYHEVNTATYQLGNKCYQFRVQPVECPTKGVIESFTISRV
jgi:hypothetical protein